MEIAVVLFDGVDELDAVGPFEVFENAASERPHADQENAVSRSWGTCPPPSSARAR